MYDWIIEADIYRLAKAAREASTPEERRKLKEMAEAKAKVLAVSAGDQVAASLPAVDRSLELLRMPVQLRD